MDRGFIWEAVYWQYDRLGGIITDRNGVFLYVGTQQMVYYQT
jgi:hypothetical protein